MVFLLGWLHLVILSERREEIEVNVSLFNELFCDAIRISFKNNGVDD
jgi:hypothetical protein